MASLLPRLKRRPEFLRVAASRRKWVAPGLILQVRRHTNPDPSLQKPRPFRIGFTVSRKVGNAVARNRARRRLKAAAEDVMPRLAKNGFDYVVIGRQNTLKRPYQDLIKDLEMALKHMGAMKKAAIGETENQATSAPDGEQKV